MENLSVAWKKSSNPEIELFQDEDNKWRWRVTGKNGEVMALAIEGFEDKSDCVENLKEFASAIALWLS